jgi:hypothetical protein
MGRRPYLVKTIPLNFSIEKRSTPATTHHASERTAPAARGPHGGPLIPALFGPERLAARVSGGDAPAQKGGIPESPAQRGASGGGAVRE